jgi:hypothetical protein
MKRKKSASIVGIKKLILCLKNTILDYEVYKYGVRNIDLAI